MILKGDVIGKFHIDCGMNVGVTVDDGPGLYFILFYFIVQWIDKGDGIKIFLILVKKGENDILFI